MLCYFKKYLRTATKSKNSVSALAPMLFHVERGTTIPHVKTKDEIKNSVSLKHCVLLKHNSMPKICKK